MRLKLAVLTLYGLGLIAAMAMLAGPFSSTASGRQESLPKDQIVMLNVKGTRTHGAVRFDHRQHEAVINPDPNWPYPAKQGAACVGCHHTVNNIGVPQLWKCTVCHQDEGKGDGRYVSTKNLNCDQSGNPKNRDCDEVFYERAFHDSCIGCHRAELARGKEPDKVPITCSGCHDSRGKGGGVITTSSGQ